MESLLEKIKRLLENYFKAEFFCGGSNSMLQEIRNEFITKVTVLVNEEEVIDAKCKMLSDTLEAVLKALNYKPNVYSVIPKNIKTENNERFKVEKIEFKPVPKHYIKELRSDENKLEIKVAKYNGETIIYLFNNVDSYKEKYNKLSDLVCKQHT